MPPRKRGKNLNTTRIVEILNADGTPAEIAEATGYSISTVRNTRKLEGGIGDTFRLLFVEERLLATGLIVDRGDLFDALPEDGEIAAVIGLHHWRKCGAVVQNRRSANEAAAEQNRKLEEADQQIAGMRMINGSMERFIARGGRLN